MLRGRRAPGRGPQAVAAAAALLLAAVSGRDCPGPGSNTSELRAFASSMFHHGYDNYMEHAFPYDELDPIHCRGRGVDEDASNININDVLGNFSLTLVDTLDTLALMGNYSEFWRAVKLVQEHVSFDVNSTVQVFEANIRMLGGLISAHLIAKDPDFGMQNDDYDDELLWLARDLAGRLLPAFENTPCGIPHPRVNLRTGVPRNGRNDTCTAGAGTLILEFGVLSRLTNDPIFEAVARRALLALWSYRDNRTGLVGSTLDMQTCKWLDQTSGLGAGVDSFYEYIYKAYVLFGQKDYAKLVNDAFAGMFKQMRVANLPVFANVHMRTGMVVNKWTDSLQAYVSGMLVSSGHVREAVTHHAAYYKLWSTYGGIPERYNYQSKVPEIAVYPLRPEFVESTYTLHRVTKDPFYREVGRQIMCDLEEHTRVACGYATLHSVQTKEKEDRMESFFLSETIKYLYLLFDDANVLHNKAWNHVFTTQAHVIRLSSLYRDRHGASAAPSTLGAFTCAKVKPLKVLVREVASLVEMVNRSFG